MRLHIEDIVGLIPPWMHIGGVGLSLYESAPLRTLLTGRWGRSNANVNGFLLYALSILEGGVDQCKWSVGLEWVYLVGGLVP
jgi:hypothetical protein